ncbi:MAG: 1-(5-phosphoribosyl)-5-[Clostridia bacterium]|nr:1-(5-phosphoribosyl)-5-[(5-phosphoribosylamino)methylideneamino]imidazole-4-carboxamide isomerase [Clostridia bacterium]MBQ5793049.1 1-(5-phosphoribosyl)-5-[(5-phosphoribosylamino)methylideneamino]imidazole-4-carboxamide isomerase [Clostridia bacterium]
MILFPAIDLIGGKAVRLTKGDYTQMTVYNDNPVAVAQSFETAGATHIHVVDLEGARDGTTPNYETVCAIIKNTSLKLEIGGGIRDMHTVEKYLQAGAFRVILGTAALTDPDFLMAAVAKYGDKIAVGADLRDSMVATHGWLQTSNISGADFIRSMQAVGVRVIICTDISKDGVMGGTNRALYESLQVEFPQMCFTASGGISDIETVKALANMHMYGAILGKALYTGAIDLAQAVREVAE